MGEEKQEVAKVETKVEEKKEEKPAEEKKEEKPAEEKKEETAPSPPPPIILSVQLHCVGCAKKIERSIWKCKGVEEVEVDMGQNKVTVKGAVDPQALCTRIQKKTMRSAKVLSPLPPADGEATNPEAPPPPQVSGVATVELLVNMHCEACAQQLRRKILKMRGVQAVETELTTRKVTVTGTMDAEQLVKYIYQKTRKLAKVIPPPPPPPPPKEEEKKEEAEKKPEEKPAEEKKEEKVEEKKEEEKAPQEQATTDGEEQKKEGEGEVAAITDEDMAKKLAYIYGGGMINYRPMHSGSVMNYGPMYGGGMMNYGGGMMNYGYGAGMVNELEEMARRMVPWRPLYIAEQPPLPPPPSQMFSDENPNACSIS